MYVCKSKVFTLNILNNLALCTLLLTAVGCGDDASGAPDAAQDAAGLDAAPGPDSGFTPDAAVAAEATEITVDLHTSNQYMYLLAIPAAEPAYAGSDWDLSVTNAMPNPPTFLLGPGVTAINLGAGAGFHEVNEAPTGGYDDDDPDAIIGTAWQDGGTGAAGFDVTGAIYVLQLADATYAKLEVLSAQQGVVRVRLYRQGDGTRNLTTAP